MPTLCIPRVYPNITETRISRVFRELDMGTIERIDVVGKSSKEGDKFNRVFIHFRNWNNNENANAARELLLNGKEVKIIYDDPWFWKVSAYREPKERHPPSQRNDANSNQKQDTNHRSKKPVIVFSQQDDFVRVSRGKPKRNASPPSTTRPLNQYQRKVPLEVRSPSSSPPPDLLAQESNQKVDPTEDGQI
jgi:hypothetical protein